MKKITMGLGAIASTVAPIAAVVSCGETKIPTVEEYNKLSKEFETIMSSITDPAKSVKLQAEISKIAPHGGTLEKLAQKAGEDGKTFSSLSDDEKTTLVDTVNKMIATAKSILK